MYQDLYEYLLLNKQLSLPGIGTLAIDRKPSATDITYRQINPPSYTIALHQDNSTPTKKFFYWLAARLDIQYHEAIVRFNGFVFDLKSRVMSGTRVTWDHIGILSKSIAGDIKFETFLREHAADTPVSAVKIIRDKAVHKVRVGEEEKTSEEMSTILAPEEEVRSYWWAPALIAAIILVIVIGLYLSQQGVRMSAIGNQHPVSTEKNPEPYLLGK